MIITCPHCQTKYQVTYEAIGSAGRKVQCAHCHQAWNQDPVPQPVVRSADAVRNDALFEAMAEDALDDAMAAEASAVAAEAPRVAKPAAAPSRALPGTDAAELQKRQQAFNRRQNAMISSLPLARLRRAARLAGIVLLAGLVGGAWFGRVAIVERYPDMAGVYEAVGLGVNVVGLDFSNLETLKALSAGNEVLTVSAQIVGLEPRPVEVPPVVISLLDAGGSAVYEWSVAPRVSNLMAGERATFDTRLSLPPSEAVRVRLSFAGRGATSTTATTETAPADAAVHVSPPAEPSHAAPSAGHADPAAEPDHAPEPAATEHH
ncbi:zinc-ribbon domain-containing protein [Devosia sediminis]|uniref:Zinc-ribbon domain-containing protein n=1 Tax=Devosia sediminis TaxID=2798801 RepID=A0A934J1Q8_9HYPH|nr:zinc-ribbon domain-containing protein [Devosia sediminis]MBJ3786252.1 zinc-ribbon domain-containing protein [Devosia sediminis]